MNRASSSAGKAPPHNQPPRQSPGRFCVWRGRIVRERKGSIRPCGARQRHAPIRCHGRREAVRRETIRRRFAPGEPAASARRRRKLPRKGRLQQKVAAALGKRCEERRASCPVDDGQVYFGLGERLLRRGAPAILALLQRSALQNAACKGANLSDSHALPHPHGIRTPPKAESRRQLPPALCLLRIAYLAKPATMAAKSANASRPQRMRAAVVFFMRKSSVNQPPLPTL